MPEFRLPLFKSPPVAEGWQSISFPFKVAVTALPAVLDSINGKWDVVQHYDVNTSTYLTYATFLPPSLNTLTDLQYTDGFAIHILEDCELVIDGDLVLESEPIPLKIGFNQVGFPSPSKPDYTVADAKADTGATQIWGCGPHPCIDPALLPDGFVLYTGMSVWFLMTSDYDWSEWYDTGLRNVEFKNAIMLN
jgi:hypothetical protein